MHFTGTELPLMVMDAMVDDIAIPFSKGHSNFKFFKKLVIVAVRVMIWIRLTLDNTLTE